MGDDGLIWFSIEVFNGRYPVSEWQNNYGQSLLEQAFFNGAREWDLQRHLHGVVLELGFSSREGWNQFIQSLSAQRAFEAVPDPISGFIIHEGRGGPSSKDEPRKPRPLIDAGAVALPLPPSLVSDVFDVHSSAVEQRFLRNVMSNN